MESFMDAWLTHGAPHHFVTTLGDHRPRWRHFARQLGLEYGEI
jgi:L-arabinose isomerase